MRGPGRPRKENHDDVTVCFWIPQWILGNPENPDSDTGYTVAKYQRDFRLKSRSQAIRSLVEIGLLLVEKRDLIKDPIFLQQWKYRMEQRQFVDYLATLPDNDLNAIFEAIRTEREIRTVYKKPSASFATENGR